MKRPFRVKWVLASLCLAHVSVIAGAAAAPAGPTEKIKITRLDDLPQHTYPFTGKVVELVKSDDQIAKLAGKVRADIESDLATYDIADATTLQRMYGTLLTIDLIERRYDAALARVEQIRNLEDKEAKRLMTGLTTQAGVAARREVGSDGMTQKYKEAFRRHLADRISKLPWDVVQDNVQQAKGRLEIVSENLLMGVIQARLEPVVAQTGELSADLADTVIGMHFTLRERLPLKEQVVAVFQEFIDANKTEKANIWPARSVKLSKSSNLAPVLIGVWDSGTDIEIFKDRLFVNAGEKLDGKDTDGNGYVDDVHGIAYDMHARRTTHVLKPLGDAADRMPRVMQHLKGLIDLQASVDSPEVAAIKKHLAGLAPSDVQGFLEDLGLAGGYVHGTHVAGIIAEGNPFARLLIARHSYDYHMKPVVRTVEWAKRDAAKCRDTVEYFKKHGVRVVNMSWGEAQKDAEESFERNGIGESAEERRELARKVFALQKEGLFEAIKNAPDILFVCAAGNADNDVEFDEYIASSFDLPNLLVAGAVDQAGDPTSFTSSGRTVQVYSNGFEVNSYVPGGKRMKLSGTSMASPNVANLAAKLLAVDPALNPTQLIDLIKKGADRKTAGGMSYLLINPKRTLGML